METLCKFSKGKTCPIRDREGRKPKDLECVACSLSLIAFKIKNHKLEKEGRWRTTE